MRKKLFTLLVALMCLFSLNAITVHASEDVVKNDETGVPDEALYKAILRELGKKENETFTKQEAAALDWLDTHAGSITSLKGIGCLTNLDQLDLEYLKIKNLDGLEELKKLKALNLDGSQVEDWGLIGSLQTIEYISLDHCNFTSLKGIGLENLTGLKSFSAAENKLKNVKEIRNLKNLEIVHLDENRLTNIKDLKGLVQLKELSLSNNQLKDIKGIKNLKHLEKLNLAANKLKNVDELRQLSSVWSLDLAGNNLKKLPDLKKKGKLKTVFLEYNYLTEKEIKNKIPGKIVKEKGWKQDSVNFQKDNVTVKLNAPANAKKIGKNTKTISGTVSKMPGYKKAVYVSLYNETKGMFYYKSKKTQRWKVNADGTFEINGLNLKKWAGDTILVNAMIYSEQLKDWKTVSSVTLKVKK